VAERRLEAPFIARLVARLVRRRVAVAHAEPMTPQRLALGRLVAATVVVQGDVLDLVAGDRFVEVGSPSERVHDRLEVGSRPVEERREAEPPRVREVLALLEGPLHLADAGREELGVQGTSAELGPRDGGRCPTGELLEQVRLALPRFPDHVVRERKRVGETEAHRLLEKAGGPRRADRDRPPSQRLPRETELRLPDRHGETQVVHERHLDPIRARRQGETEATGDLGELLDRDGQEAGVVALGFRDGPPPEGGRRGGGRQDEAREQEREQADARVRARELFEVAGATRVVRGREDAGPPERARRSERAVREESADRHRQLAEERFRPR